MPQRTSLITGVSSGFGRHLIEQLLDWATTWSAPSAGPTRSPVLPHMRAAGRIIQLVQQMLDPANGVAPGDPARMAARIIESLDIDRRRCAWSSAPRHSRPR